MKPWVASILVLSIVTLLAYISSTVKGGHGGNAGKAGSAAPDNERLLRQAAAFLKKSKSTNNHIATLLHSARARVLAAAVVPSTPESRDLVVESREMESLAASIVKRRSQTVEATPQDEPAAVDSLSGFTPMNFAGKGM